MSIKSALARLFRHHVKIALAELAAEKTEPRPQYNYERLSYEIAAHESARYLIDHMQEARDFISNEEVFRRSLAACTVEGLALEFGVFKGSSINVIAAHMPQEVHGFDSFEGLPEDWTHFQKAGRFDLGGNMPAVRENVRLHKGWFDDTLPPFLETHPGPIRFLHIDSDLYSSAKTVLTLCEPRIVPGTVIQFDEYLNYPGWQQHEYKAWQEFVERTGVKYRYLGFASCQCAVSVVVG